MYFFFHFETSASSTVSCMYVFLKNCLMMIKLMNKSDFFDKKFSTHKEERQQIVLGQTGQLHVEK